MGKTGPLRGTKPTDWRSDMIDLQANLEQARLYARMAYHILRQCPTDPCEYDDMFAEENLPAWIHISPRTR